MTAKKLYVLNTGYLETDKNNVVGGATVGTRSTPIINNDWIKLPVMAFLIETEDGYILYDTGSNPEAMKGYWPNNLQEIYPLYQEPEERLDAQLRLCGVEPEEVKTVVLSHLHLDHAGGLYLFHHAKVYVPAADYKQALAMTHQNPNPTTHGGYVRGDMEEPISQVVMVEDDFELAPGVEVVNLPGHTPGLLGLVVHLEGGTIILPQDSVYTAENYGPPARVSGLLHDTLAYFRSMEKVRTLEKRYNAKVIFAHDYEFFQTLKLAPEYYE